jgi:beta-N-acetylhexosaminidase
MSKIPVGRLLCVGIRGALPGERLLENDLDLCKQVGVGGVILFDVDVPTMKLRRAGGAEVDVAARQAPRNIIDPQQLEVLVAHVRARLGDHVFVCIDQEGGHVARLSPSRGFGEDPSAGEFSALGPEARVEAARRQAQQLQKLGFDLNFAPCVDVALDPENEVIVRRQRSYGSDPLTVIEAARIVLNAHSRAGVAACLKHFPGHGSSRGDTHRESVNIGRTWRRREELAPYEALSRRAGVAVMVAHVRHEGLDRQFPASLSPAIIQDLLRGEVGFDGVVVCDSIDMRAVADRFSPEAAAVAAVEAGVDLVLDGFNLEPREEHPAPVIAEALRAATHDGRIRGGAKRIEESLMRLERLRAEIGRPW